MGGTVPGIRGVYIGIDIEVIITLSCVPKIASDLIIECVSLALSLSMYFVASDKIYYYRRRLGWINGAHDLSEYIII